MKLRLRGKSLLCAGSVLAIAAMSACSSASKAQSESEKASASSAGVATGGAQPTGTSPWHDPWLGKADVSVFLCTATDPKTEGCTGGAATATQRDAIRAKVQGFPEVREVFYESPQQAYENLKRMSPEVAKNVTPEALPDAFRVKLRDPAQFPDNLAGLRGTPGIALVSPVK